MRLHFYCKQKLYVTALGTYEQILFENLRGVFYFHQINLQRQMKIFCHMKTPVNLSSISWMTESFHWRSMAISLSPMPMVLPDLSMSRAPKAQLILRKGVVVRCSFESLKMLEGMKIVCNKIINRCLLI